MVTETISFACPACGVKLTIPGQLAGIVGPCPSCQTQIQAPQPATVIPNTLQQAAGVVPIPAGPTPVKPEPRQRPQRPEQLETLTKPVAEMPPSTSTDSRIPPAAPMPKRSKKHLMSIFVPLFFLAASAAVMFGVLMFLKKRPDQPMDRKVKNDAEKVRMILEEDLTKKKPTPAKGAPATLPVPPVEMPKMPEISEPTDAGIDIPNDTAEAPPGVSSLRVLEKFLRTSTLTERMPMIESRLNEAELAGTCLAGPLKTTLNISTEVQETNALEKVTEVYFNVDFEEDDGTINPQTILVRTRGTAEPKVVVDPFLDLYGGRLAEYTKTPTKDAGNFQVIVSAVPSCHDSHVPNREKKRTLKLMSRDNTREIARAYFGKQSKIAEMLENDVSGLRYGQAQACTLMLRWNMEEDPEKPYLEALLVRALDWNP